MDKVAVYRRIARFYDILDYPLEFGRYQALRPHLFAGLSGRVLDAGVGTGRNMPFYPPGADMVGIDLSPHMLARARARRETLGVDIELIEADALHTPFPDNHFDAVVATFLFCVLDDEHQQPGLRELGRICKPDGEIRLLEYVYTNDPWRRLIMRLWAPWVRFAYGASFDRNTASHVPAAGLEFVGRRFLFRDAIEMLVLRRRKLDA